MIEAIRAFEQQQKSFEPLAIRQHVAPFDRIHFKRQIQEVIFKNMGDFLKSSKASFETLDPS